MRRTALLLLWLPAACNLKLGDPTAQVQRLVANPADTDAMADLAVLGSPSVDPLLAALEDSGLRPELRRAACATLAVAGEPCAGKMIEYLDRTRHEGMQDAILEVMAKGRWMAAVRKLTDRIGHDALGRKAYGALARILAGEEIPRDPWASGNPDVEAVAEWNRWVGMNAPRLIKIGLGGSRFGRSEKEAVRERIQAELPGW